MVESFFEWEVTSLTWQEAKESAPSWWRMMPLHMPGTSHTRAAVHSTCPVKYIVVHHFWQNKMLNTLPLRHSGQLSASMKGQVLRRPQYSSLGLKVYQEQLVVMPQVFKQAELEVNRLFESQTVNTPT